MSDECLIASEQRFPYCTCCQAVTRKFTLAHQAVPPSVLLSRCPAQSGFPALSLRLLRSVSLPPPPGFLPARSRPPIGQLPASYHALKGLYILAQGIAPVKTVPRFHRPCKGLIIARPPRMLGVRHVTLRVSSLTFVHFLLARDRNSPSFVIA